jgi:polyhydroxybutyrate depolymerase
MKFSHRDRILRLLLLIIIMLSACAPNLGGGRAERLPAGWTQSSLDVDGLTRWYRVFVPDSLPGNPALVLYLHGGTLSMRSITGKFAGGTAEWIRLAETEGFLLLVPNGVNARTGDTFGNDQNWNDFRPDSASGQSDADDTHFLLTLIEEISALHGVDQDRIYVTGASNGGLMTYRLLIDLPEQFAAGAAFIANLPDPVDQIPFPASPTPLLIANGSEDPLMPWEGGVVGRDRGQVISAAETVAWWVRANQASLDRMVSRLLPDINSGDGCQVRMDVYPAAGEGAEVVFYALVGGGHTMPSIDRAGLDTWLTRRLVGPVCREVEGVRLAWDFFSGNTGFGP